MTMTNLVQGGKVMKFTGHKCDFCKKSTEDVYTEKGWIFIDKLGFHVTNGRKEGDKGEARVMIFYSPLHFTLGDNSLDFCSLKCFLDWLFLSDTTSNMKSSTLEERHKFMKEILRQSRLRFY